MKFCLVLDNHAYIVTYEDRLIYLEFTEILDGIYKYNISLFLKLYNRKFGLDENAESKENSKLILDRYGKMPFLNPEFMRLNNEVIEEWESNKVITSSLIDWLKRQNCKIEEISEVLIL